jgi:hypothetical protein
MIEDGVVDSPLSRSALPVLVSFPSPLRKKSRSMAQILDLKQDSRSSCKLYNSPSSFHSMRSVENKFQKLISFKFV